MEANMECYCGRTAKLTTSWKDTNPGRRFLACPGWPVSVVEFVEILIF